MASRVSRVASDEVSDLLDDYWEALQASPLADKSIEDYFYFAYCFVRWMNGEFTPGDKVQGK